MIIAVDVGNTNITFGIFKGDKIVGSFRMTTKTPRTSDEYSLVIKGLIEQQKIDINDIEDVIISSVVPNIMHSFINGFIKLFGKRPFVVGPGTKTGIRTKTTNPAEIGADRIVDAAGAYLVYGGPVIVIDFGTATTYDLIGEDGTFETGITSPGVRMCAKALWEDTAKLPEIEIKKPKSIIVVDTIESMQAGLVYGYIGQTEYIIDKIKEEYNRDDIKVVATGGLGKIISEETKKIDKYDANLTLNGLRLIYEKNHKSK